MLDSLGIHLPQFIAQVVNFGVLFIILYLVGYKSFLKMMDERSNKIKESLEAGERAKQEAAASQDEVAKKLEEATREGQQIVAKAVEAAEEVKKNATANAKQEAAQIIEKAQIEAKREQDEALNELRKDVADLAVVVAGKAIGNSLDDNTQRKLIDEALKEATALKQA
jgi:F-type H+-transporting ATPase subunit b